MFSAFAKAIFQLPEKSLRRVVWIGILGSIAVFAGLWFIITLGIASFGIVETSWFGFLLSGIAGLVAPYCLFPSVATLIVGFFWKTWRAPSKPSIFPAWRSAASKISAKFSRLL